MESLQGLSKKEIIDVKDGKRLGYANDCEIDLYSGRIISLIISCGGFWHKEDLIIAWNSIVKIGEDIIIVDTHRRKQNEHKYDDNKCDEHNKKD